MVTSDAIKHGQYMHTHLSGNSDIEFGTKLPFSYTMLQRLQSPTPQCAPPHTPTPLEKKNDRDINSNAHTDLEWSQHSLHTQCRQCPSSSTTLRMSAFQRSNTHQIVQQTAKRHHTRAPPPMLLPSKYGRRTTSISMLKLCPLSFCTSYKGRR